MLINYFLKLVSRFLFFSDSTSHYTFFSTLTSLNGSTAHLYDETRAARVIKSKFDNNPIDELNIFNLSQRAHATCAHCCMCVFALLLECCVTLLFTDNSRREGFTSRCSKAHSYTFSSEINASTERKRAVV